MWKIGEIGTGTHDCSRSRDEVRAPIIASLFLSSSTGPSRPFCIGIGKRAEWWSSRWRATQKASSSINTVAKKDGWTGHTELKRFGLISTYFILI